MKLYLQKLQMQVTATPSPTSGQGGTRCTSNVSALGVDRDIRATSDFYPLLAEIIKEATFTIVGVVLTKLSGQTGGHDQFEGHLPDQSSCHWRINSMHRLRPPLKALEACAAKVRKRSITLDCWTIPRKPQAFDDFKLLGGLPAAF